MICRLYKILVVAFWICILSALLFSEYFASGFNTGWCKVIIVEIQSACRDPRTQWMVFLCAGIYFVTFTALAARVAKRRFWKPTNPDLWLSGLLLVTALTYAFDYEEASTSTQALMLLSCATFGKGICTWTLWAKADGERERRMGLLIVVLVLLLASAALWQPTMFTEYQYRGQRRWNGAWDNPNIYGMLMAVGMVLTCGILISVSRRRNPDAGIRSSVFRSLWFIVFLIAAALCGFGLLNSYSRGAWLGAMVGLAFLAWRWSKAKSHPTLSLRPTGGVRQYSCDWWLLWLRNKQLSLSVIMLSIAVILFWQFRDTDWPPARRIFSVANINDFSWRNRVTAWHGAFQMMANKPLAGFGWGNAEEAYRTEYRRRRLEETAAIQMNDYLILGISAGVPALMLFLIYVWLSLTQLSIGFSMACQCSIIVLLFGFCFDGGLFKLPTAALFWSLLELGRGNLGLAATGRNVMRQ